MVLGRQKQSVRVPGTVDCPGPGLPQTLQAQSYPAPPGMHEVSGSPTHAAEVVENKGSSTVAQRLNLGQLLGLIVELLELQEVKMSVHVLDGLLRSKCSLHPTPISTEDLRKLLREWRTLPDIGSQLVHRYIREPNALTAGAAQQRPDKLNSPAHRGSTRSTDGRLAWGSHVASSSAEAAARTSWSTKDVDGHTQGSKKIITNGGPHHHTPVPSMGRVPSGAVQSVGKVQSTPVQSHCHPPTLVTSSGPAELPELLPTIRKANTPQNGLDAEVPHLKGTLAPIGSESLSQEKTRVSANRKQAAETSEGASNQKDEEDDLDFLPASVAPKVQGTRSRSGSPAPRSRPDSGRCDPVDEFKNAPSQGPLEIEAGTEIEAGAEIEIDPSLPKPVLQTRKTELGGCLMMAPSNQSLTSPIGSEGGQEELELITYLIRIRIQQLGYTHEYISTIFQHVVNENAGVSEGLIRFGDFCDALQLSLNGRQIKLLYTKMCNRQAEIQDEENEGELAFADFATVCALQEAEEEDEEEDLEAMITEAVDPDKSDAFGDNQSTVILVKARYLIHPNSVGRHLWEVLSIFFIIGEALLIPLTVGLGMELHEGWLWTTTVFFSIDIVLSCFTGYYEHGVLVMDQKRIIRRFVQSTFVVDFVSTVPWEHLGRVLGASSNEQGDLSLLRSARWLKLFRLFRLVRIVKLNKLMQHLEELIPGMTFMATASLLKTFCLFTLLCHWAACAWGFVGSPDRTNHSSINAPPHDISVCEPGGSCEPGILGSPWLRRYGLDNPVHDDVGTHYLTSLTFAIALITGGEWGMQPGWWAERVYTCIMMVVSFMVCATILSQVVVFVDKFSRDHTAFKENLAIAKEYLVRRKVPRNLRMKVCRYLEFQFRSRMEHGDCVQFIEQLSPWLRLQVKDHLNREILERHPFFEDMQSSAFKRVCSIAHTVLYAPGDIVAQRGHAASCMFFVVAGKLKILNRDMSDDKNEILEAPSWLGDQCLFQEITRVRTVICLTHAELLTLPRDLFHTILHEFPKTRPWYEKWQEKVLNGDLVSAGIRCEVCNGFGHSANDCPEALRRAEELSRLFQSDPSSQMGRSKESRSSSGKLTMSTMASAVSSKLSSAVETMYKQSSREHSSGQLQKFASISEEPAPPGSSNVSDVRISSSGSGTATSFRSGRPGSKKGAESSRALGHRGAAIAMTSPTAETDIARTGPRGATLEAQSTIVLDKASTVDVSHVSGSHRASDAR